MRGPHRRAHVQSGVCGRRHPSELLCRGHGQVRRNKRTALVGCGSGAPLTAATLTGFLSAQASDMCEGHGSRGKQGKVSIPGIFFLLPAGQYNETVFRAIDYMLAQADRFNLKVRLTQT